MRWEPLLLGVALPLKILGEQVYGWLRSGEWVAVSAIDLLMLGWDDPWLTYPQDWIGVHWTLSHLPGALFAALILLPGCVLWLLTV